MLTEKETKHTIETIKEKKMPIITDSSTQSIALPKESMSDLLYKATIAIPKSIMLYLSDRTWSMEPYLLDILNTTKERHTTEKTKKALVFLLIIMLFKINNMYYVEKYFRQDWDMHYYRKGNI